jgi:hypothetical protein
MFFVKSRRELSKKRRTFFGRTARIKVALDVLGERSGETMIREFP